MTFIHRTMIVPAAFVDTSKGLCKGLAGDAGDRMFITALGQSASGPVTHYISAGYISAEMADFMPWAQASTDPVTRITTVSRKSQGQPDLVRTEAAKKNMPVTTAKVTQLFDAIDVSDQEPFVAMARLGLVLVQTGTAL